MSAYTLALTARLWFAQAISSEMKALFMLVALGVLVAAVRLLLLAREMDREDRRP